MTDSPVIDQHKTEQATYLPLGLVAPSPTNPRKRFNQAKIDELADSIKKHGVIQPALVRRNPSWSEGNGQPPYELVCGERRWRASKQAEQTSILVLIRDISDFEALELQLLENLDRDDLHPLEEADGLQKLLRTESNLLGYASPEDLAAKVGKSRRWVYLRLALLNLCNVAREAFLADKINASLANLIARMPFQGQQADATHRILEGFGGEPYTVRAASDFLRKTYMLALDKAPFDITAIYACASACGTCQKRSGAAPDLFDDVKDGDLCQDSACYQSKVVEHHEALLTKAEIAGHTVLRGAAAAKLMPYAKNVLPGGYLWFDEPAAKLTADPRPLSEIFGSKQRGVVTLEHNSGSIVRIVAVDDATKLLKTKGLLRVEPKAKMPQITAAATEQDRAPGAQLSSRASAKAPTAKPLTPTQLQGAIEKRAGELFSQMLAKTLADQVDQADDLPLLALRLSIERILDDASTEACDLVFEQMGWPTSEIGDWYTVLRKRLAALGGDDLGRLLVYSLYAEPLTEGDDLEDMRSAYAKNDALAFAEHYEVDVDGLQAEASEGAAVQVRNEEARRLGLPVQDGPASATEAFVQTHAPAPAPPSSKPGSVKYRNAATGETWSGRGLQPKWLKAAMSGGAKLSDFEVEAGSKPATKGGSSKPSEQEAAQLAFEAAEDADAESKQAGGSEALA